MPPSVADTLNRNWRRYPVRADGRASRTMTNSSTGEMRALLKVRGYRTRVYVSIDGKGGYSTGLLKSNVTELRRLIKGCDDDVALAAQIIDYGYSIESRLQHRDIVVLGHQMRR